MSQFTRQENGRLHFYTKDGKLQASIGPGWTRSCPNCGRVQKLELRDPGNGVVHDQPRCCRGEVSESVTQ